MRFSLIASALAFVAGAIAQTSVGPNAFNEGTNGTQVYKSGQSYPLTWSNLQGKTVTIQLRSGDRSDLKPVQTIVSNYGNTGSYSWTPDATLATGADYALEIIDDDDTSLVNYSGQFVVETPVQAVSADSSTSLLTVTTPSAASTTTGSASGSASASTTGSATGSASVTAKATISTGTAAASHTSHAATSATSAAVPANAAAKPATGALSGLLLVAAGFAVAL